MQELDQGYKMEISVYSFKYRPFSYQIYISEVTVILSTKPSNVLLTSFTAFGVFFLTVHHSIDLFHLPTLMHNSCIH
jgi:predicted transcriptional regulator with HTH domain